NAKQTRGQHEHQARAGITSSLGKLTFGVIFGDEFLNSGLYPQIKIGDVRPQLNDENTCGIYRYRKVMCEKRRQQEGNRRNGGNTGQVGSNDLENDCGQTGRWRRDGADRQGGIAQGFCGVLLWQAVGLAPSPIETSGL